MLDFQNGINAAAEKYGSGIKYISVSDILNLPYITYDTIKGLVDIDGNTLDNFAVNYGDILFQRSSETQEDIGHSNVYLDSKTATFGGFVIRGRKIGEYNPIFFKHLLDTQSARKVITRLGAGAQHYNIGQDSLRTIQLYFPKTEEQNKISELLLLIDKKISLYKIYIELLKSYKRGLSEALFSGKITRWDLTNIPCGKYKLGELGYFYNGLSGKGKDDFGKGTSQYIPYLNVYKNLIADEHILENVIVSAAEKQNSVKYGDVLFTQSSETLEEVGYTSVWLSKSTPFLNSFCFGFRFFEQEQIDPYFIAHYFRSSTIRKGIMREGQGATRVNLSAERLKGMEISLPPVHIQKKVGKLLNHLEQQIEFIIQSEIQLTLYKIGLLQRLFI